MRIGFFLVLGAILYMILHQLDSSLIGATGFERYRGQFDAFRIGVLVLVILFWPQWVQLVARIRHFTEVQIQALKRLHLRLSVWIVLLELLIGQNVLRLIVH